MGLLLDEYSPRPVTFAYLVHRARAVARHQLGRLLWWLAFVGYSLSAGAAVAPYIDGPFVTRVPVVLAVSVAAGWLAALGVSAYFGPMWARLRLLLERHPQSASSIAMDYRLPPRPVFDEPCIVLGEAHVTREYEIEGGYELVYHIEESYSATPEWAVLPAKALVTGLLTFGATGSGKTAYVLKPAIFKLFHHPTRPGGLVMDSKAALVEDLRVEMEAAGRSADLRVVGPGQPTRWNPLHRPSATPAAIADTLMTALENVRGAPYSSDTQWIRHGAAGLAEGAIGLLRLRNGYVTPALVRGLLSEFQLVAKGSDTPGAEVRTFIKAWFGPSTAPTDHPGQFAYYVQLIVDRMNDDEKFRAIYLSELSALLDPLTAPEVVHLYSAPEAELDMPDWVECINKGLVVVLDCNNSIAPGLAVVLGMLLKLSYQSAILAREGLAKQGVCNLSRYMALLIDEYQDFASPSETEYQAKCRSAKSITVYLTQGYASIVQRIGEDRAKVVVQNMRNLLMLTQTMPDVAADLLGQRNTTEVDKNIAESVQGAALTANGKFGGESTVSQSYSVRSKREHAVPPEVLATLPTGQGILQSFDGERSIPPHRVYCIPSYVPPGTRAAELQKK